MKKLELRELAPYLPYGLKWSDHESIATMLELNAREAICESNYGIFRIPLSSAIAHPILRPLSDLTKEIEHDGKTFIPMDFIAEGCENDYFEESPFLDDYMEQFMQSYHTEHHLNFIPYGLIQLLISWHFDVFGLIEQGLAIDINFLNQ